VPVTENSLHTHCLLTDKTLDAVCNSLKAHPTPQVSNLWSNTDIRIGVAPLLLLKSRIQALVDMLKVIMLIHTICLRSLYSQHELFRGSVIPYLETNRLRPRLLAIGKFCPIAYRAKMLGRALLAARTNAKIFWMLLSGKAEVAFPSTTATTTPVANLPTPASGALPVKVAPGVATAAVSAIHTASVTNTRAAFATGASAVAIVAPPSACQKRKAHP
jgi:hypothetical protein